MSKTPQKRPNKDLFGYRCDELPGTAVIFDDTGAGRQCWKRRSLLWRNGLFDGWGAGGDCDGLIAFVRHTLRQNAVAQTRIDINCVVPSWNPVSRFPIALTI